MTLEYVIKQKGLIPGKDLTLDDSIKFDLMASAFTSGSADYVTLFEPTASNIEKLGKGYIVASVGKESYTQVPGIGRGILSYLAGGKKTIVDHAA